MAEYYRNAWYAQLQKKVAELEEEIRKAIELPTVTAEDDGKSLIVDDQGKWIAEHVLPVVTSEDAGMALIVSESGEWSVGKVSGGITNVTQRNSVSGGVNNVSE